MTEVIVEAVQGPTFPWLLYMRFDMKIRYLLADPRFMPRDGEEGGEPSGGEQATEGAAETQQSQSGGEGRSFTQSDVDSIVTKRVKKMKEQLEKTERRYEQMISDQNRTAQEREELASELESLQSQFRSREEQAKYEAQKREKEYKQTLESATEQAKTYRSLFETQTRNNAIIAAASQHGAFNPEQFIPLLADRTEVVEEETEQGEKTGRYVPRVRVQKKAEDGTVSEVLVTPDEAIEDMKNNVALHGNLFKGNVAKGIGEGSNNTFAGNQRVDVSKMSDDDYFKNRDAIRQQYGIKDARTRSGF